MNLDKAVLRNGFLLEGVSFDNVASDYFLFVQKMNFHVILFRNFLFPKTANGGKVVFENCRLVQKENVDNVVPQRSLSQEKVKLDQTVLENFPFPAHLPFLSLCSASCMSHRDLHCKHSFLETAFYTHCCPQ